MITMKAPYKQRIMSEGIQLARLWSKFHRLPEDDKDLVLKVSELMAGAIPASKAQTETSENAGWDKRREAREEHRH
jgi:hypothetical protein